MSARKVEINYEKAEEVAYAALEMRRRSLYPFNSPVTELFPDAKIPKKIEPQSREHALYVFHAVSLDSRWQASQVYSAMHFLVDRLESPTDLSRLHKVEEKVLLRALRPFFGEVTGTNFQADPIRVLRNNSEKLERERDSDPRNLYQRLGEVGEGSYETAVRMTLANVAEFAQYGRIAKPALLVKNMVRFGMWPIPEYDVPIKVDRHVCRISLGTGIIEPEKYAEKRDWSSQGLPKILAATRRLLIRQGLFSRKDFQDGSMSIFRFTPKDIKGLTDAFWEVTRRKKWSAIDLDDALWAVGSQMCKKNNATTCGLSCLVNCAQRFPSDNYATWFFMKVDKRQEKGQLLLDLPI